MTLNPWKRIRELELALADRDARLEVAYEQLDEFGPQPREGA